MEKLSFFSSNRERRLWFALGVVLVGIYATLGQAPAIAAALRERNQLAGGLIFALIVLLLVSPIFFIKKRPGRAEIAVGVGILVVYLMAYFRIGVAALELEERTHLFEYGLVAALIHEALLERRENGRRVPAPAVLALLISILLGWFDEGIQSILPNRVYDIVDVGFNSIAATTIIGARWVLIQVRRWSQARRGNK